MDIWFVELTGKERVMVLVVMKEIRVMTAPDADLDDSTLDEIVDRIEEINWAKCVADQLGDLAKLTKTYVY